MPIGQARKFVWHLHGSMWTLSSSWDRAWQHSICFSCLLFLFFSFYSCLLFLFFSSYSCLLFLFLFFLLAFLFFYLFFLLFLFLFFLFLFAFSFLVFLACFSFLLFVFLACFFFSMCFSCLLFFPSYSCLLFLFFSSYSCLLFLFFSSYSCLLFLFLFFLLAFLFFYLFFLLVGNRECGDESHVAWLMTTEYTQRCWRPTFEELGRSLIKMFRKPAKPSLQMRGRLVRSQSEAAFGLQHLGKFLVRAKRTFLPSNWQRISACQLARRGNLSGTCMAACGPWARAEIEHGSILFVFLACFFFSFLLILACFFFSFLLILVCFFFSCFSCLVLFCYSMYYRRQNVERETGASVKRCNAAGVPAERDPAEREAFKLKVLSAMTFKPEGVDLRLRSRSLLQGLAKVLSWGLDMY